MDYFLQQLRKKLQANFDILIPFLRFEQELENELLLFQIEILNKDTEKNKYFIVSPLQQKPLWAQDWLSNCALVSFENKSQALKILKNKKNFGVHFETGVNTKLATSLKKELRELKLKRINYEVPSKFNFKYFAWGFFDERHLIICENPVSQFPLGWHEFNEDKNTPPNRAYLKLWEVLCLNYIQLSKNDVVLDVGSSPGGWSWALSQFVKKVYSIDKAALEKNILDLPNIDYKSEDAFLLKPQDYNDCTWFFSDIICTPQRLLSLVESWHQQSTIKNFVCTIKFKGLCDYDILSEFKKYENSKIIHLYQNKNEVTWIKQVK